jgi:hypothetical protein
MNEQLWLAVGYPGEMLIFLQGRGMLSARKARLFGAACCRRVWHLLTDEKSRWAVEVAERFTEGAATAEELLEALDSAWEACHAARAAEEAYHDSKQARDASLNQGRPEGADAACRNASAAWAVACLLSGFFRTTSDLARSLMADESVGVVIAEESHAMVGDTMFGACGAARGPEGLTDTAELDAQQAILRDLFGPLPFRPVTIEPAWIAWNHGTLRRLAQALYHERSLPEGTLNNGRLAVLADALEEADCADADLLGHLRGPGPHVRGCWCVDLLLRKS